MTRMMAACTQALEVAAAVRGERGGGFGVRPADAGDMAVAPVPTLAPDPAQHVFAETDAVGPASTDTWSTFGDGGAGSAHGGR